MKEEPKSELAKALEVMERIAKNSSFGKLEEPNQFTWFAHIQPMETAPRDGTVIDLYVPLMGEDGDVEAVVRDHDRYWEAYSGVVDKWTRKEGCPAVWNVLRVEPLGWSPILKFPIGGLS